jgi:hypothetical protein
MKVGDWFLVERDEKYLKLAHISRLSKKTVYFHVLDHDKREQNLSYYVTTYVTPLVKWKHSRASNKHLQEMMKAVWSCRQFDIGLL